MGEVNIGDYVVIEGFGVYCVGMSFKNYNFFFEVFEVMRFVDGVGFVVICCK